MGVSRLESGSDKLVGRILATTRMNLSHGHGLQMLPSPLQMAEDLFRAQLNWRRLVLRIRRLRRLQLLRFQLPCSAVGQPESEVEDLAGLPAPPSCPGVGGAGSSERANTVIGAIAQNHKLQLSDVALCVRTSTVFLWGRAHHVETGDARRRPGPIKGDLLGDQIHA